MKRLSVLLCGVVLTALPSVPALADTFTFDYSFTNASAIVYGSGVMTAESDGTNQYLIESISGTFEQEQIAGLLPPGSFPANNPLANDNLLFFDPSTGTYSLDLNGVSYELANHQSDVNLFKDSNGQYEILNFSTVDLTITPVVPSTSPVPEPGSLALLGTGVVGLAGAVRRRFAV